MSRNRIHVILAIMLGAIAFAQRPVTMPTISSATCGKQACTWAAFGPQIYTRETEKPQAQTSSFTIQNPNTQYTLDVTTSDVSSADISVNGSSVFGPGDFNPNVTALSRSVQLQPSDMVSVELRGQPGSSLTAQVTGVDSDPPLISDFVVPAPNQNGWNNTSVSVSFTCADATSGIAICPVPVNITTEGLNQVATGTGFDLAGNSTTISVPVSIDETPPTITPQLSPAPNAAGWNNSPVTVNFSCADSLSGVLTCTSPVTVSTEGLNQPVVGIATDKAGNSAGASANLNIDLTPPVISVSSPANGTSFSTNSVTVTGTASDALSGLAAGGVTCNGATVQLSGGNFSCNVTLASGTNQILVQASDIAGNTAIASISVTFNQNQGPPPTAVFLTPTNASMLVNDVRSFSLVDQNGQPVLGATWSVSDPTLLTSDGANPPNFTAAAPGTVTVTTSIDGLSATSTITIYAGDELPFGTTIWEADPLAGGSVAQVLQTGVFGDNTASLITVESDSSGGSVVRGFTSDGRQLWANTSGGSSALATHAALSPRALVGPPPAGMPDWLVPMLMSNRQKAYLGQLPQHYLSTLIQYRHAGSKAGLSAVSGAMSNQLASTPLGVVGTPTTTAIDNQGGLLELFTFRPQDSIVRIDSVTGQVSWEYDSPASEFLAGQFAVGPDGSIYIVEQDGNCFENCGAHVLGLDGGTGQSKFSVQLPSSHFTGSLTACPSQGLLAQQFDYFLAADYSPISVDSNGSAELQVQYDPTFDISGSACRFTQPAVDFLANFQRLQVNPDGSSLLTDLAGPFTAFAPNIGETIADREGGLLSVFGIPGSGTTVLRETPLGNLEYTLPFSADNDVTIGEGNVGYAVGQSSSFPQTGFCPLCVYSWDLNAGSVLWSTDEPEAVTLSTALSDGLAALINPGPGQTESQLQFFDVSGNLASTGLLFSSSQVAYMGDGQWAGASSSGGVAAMAGPQKSVASSWWAYGQGSAQQNFEAGLVTKDVTVVGWVDGSAVKSPPSSSVSFATLAAFNAGFDACAASVLSLTQGLRTMIQSDTDRQYINAFLISRSSNNDPGKTIEPAKFAKAGDYRLFNRLQARLLLIGDVLALAGKVQGQVSVGSTPDPCSGAKIPVLSNPQPHDDNGRSGLTSVNQHFYQLVEGRIGDEGQRVNFTLNWCNASGLTKCDLTGYQSKTPWIWTAIEFDHTGTPNFNDQIFPTYSFYVSGANTNTTQQTDLSVFTALDGSSQLKAKDIQ